MLLLEERDPTDVLTSMSLRDARNSLFWWCATVLAPSASVYKMTSAAIENVATEKESRATKACWSSERCWVFGAVSERWGPLKQLREEP